MAQYTHLLCSHLSAAKAASVHLLTPERETLPQVKAAYTKHDRLRTLAHRSRMSVHLTEFRNACTTLWLALRLRPSTVLFQSTQCGRLDPWIISALRILRTRVVWTAHDTTPHESRECFPRYARRVYRQVDEIITLSKSERDRLLFFVAEADAKTRIIPHGDFRDLARTDLSQAAARRILGLPGTAKVLLCFGYLKPYKGIDDLLVATARLRHTSPDMKIMLAGGCQPQDAEQLAQRITELGIDSIVRLCPGYLPLERTSTYFAAADLVVLPHREASQSGITHMAYAHARPVVVTNAGGLPADVDCGITGEVSIAKDPRSLSETVTRVLSPAWKLAEKQALLATNPPERFLWENILPDYTEALGLSDRTGNTPDTKRPIIVFYTDVLWNGVWYSKQHLAQAITKKARVLFVEAPVSPASVLRSPSRAAQLLKRKQHLSTDLAVLAPLGIPPQEHPKLVKWNARLLARQTRSFLKKLDWHNSDGVPAPDMVIAGLPRAWRLQPAFPTALWAAHLTDRLANPEEIGISNRERLLSTADVAIAVSEPLVAESVSYELPVLLLPQGVDTETLLRSSNLVVPLDLACIPDPRLLFLGNLTDRLDLALIEKTAANHSQWQFVFVGGTSFAGAGDPTAQLRRIPNVHLLGPKPREQLGTYLAHCDAAWSPYTWSDFNQASNPLKIMEYLAIGLPVVANRFAALVSLQEHVSLVTEDGDWNQPLTDALAGKAGTTHTASTAQKKNRMAFAAENSWEKRAENLTAFLLKEREDRPPSPRWPSS